MKISYETSNLGDYAVVYYGVTIYNEDDSVHLPRYEYNGYILIKGEDISKTDDEIYEMVVNHMKDNVKERYGYTFEEMEADPAFKSINICVSKQLYFAKEINIGK